MKKNQKLQHQKPTQKQGLNRGDAEKNNDLRDFEKSKFTGKDSHKITRDENRK